VISPERLGAVRGATRCRRAHEKAPAGAVIPAGADTHRRALARIHSRRAIKITQRHASLFGMAHGQVRALRGEPAEILRDQLTWVSAPKLATLLIGGVTAACSPAVSQAMISLA